MKHDPHPHDDPRYPVQHSDAEWRAKLDPMQYQVARHAATERAFTGRYWDHFEDGIYRCVGCCAPLFDALAPHLLSKNAAKTSSASWPMSGVSQLLQSQ